MRCDSERANLFFTFSRPTCTDADAIPDVYELESRPCEHAKKIRDDDDDTRGKAPAH
jgi:hypothetical protein